jgi:hypothetical protein
MRHAVSVGVVAVVVLCVAGISAAAEPADDAVAAGKAWLADVDAGRYEESWERAGATLRQAVTREQWKQAANGSRAPMGEVKSRELASRQEATTLPGAPDGQYVVMQFETAFAHKAAAVETVTTVLEADGKWRVVGYFIK